MFPLSFSSDSSDDSDDSSSSSSDDSDDEEAPLKDGRMGVCKLCQGDKRRNKEGHHESLVRCAKCKAEGLFLSSLDGLLFNQ